MIIYNFLFTHLQNFTTEARPEKQEAKQLVDCGQCHFRFLFPFLCLIHTNVRVSDACAEILF